MQATSTRRLVRSRAGGMAVAFIGLLVVALVVVTAVLTPVGAQSGTSRELTEQVSSAGQYDQARFPDEDTWQILYNAPPTPSREESRPLEKDTCAYAYHQGFTAHSPMD